MPTSSETEWTSDPARIDRERTYAWIRSSYWAAGIPRATFERSLDGSLCFAGFRKGEQVAFARCVTDRATFAWLADVWVAEEARGQGLGKELMAFVVAHPDLQGLRRFVLSTADAHGLYAAFGFEPLTAPEMFMCVHAPDVYRDASHSG